MTSADSAARSLDRAAEEYRTFVGPGEQYDVFSAMQFNLLTALGLREHHTLLDIGCGSLRAGRLLIPYLRSGHYFGLEPERWLLEQGIRNEVSEALIALKRVTFAHDRDFRLTAFGRNFDYLIAQSVFSHVPAAQIDRCFAEAAEVMTPSSVFVASFFEGPEDYRGSATVVRAEFRFATIVALAERHRLVCERLAWPHPDGQQWLVIRREGGTFTVPPFGDHTRVANLERELAACTRRLEKLERHPYVRLGMRLSRAGRWLGFLVRVFTRPLTQKPRR
ncbi:MAG: class I SAM-dependent methyltransferase [Rhodospirillales bacterium]|nr:MAG: class I SAM-dependent methyltransferase [Rhodospirillales bacterium]